VRAKRKSKAFLLRGFLGIKSKSKSSRRSGRGVPPGSGSAAGTCDRVVKVSFGRVECREFARTVGDNEVVGPISVFGLGGVECHGSVRGSVRRLSGSGA
jgi:hypothetical protein